MVKKLITQMITWDPPTMDEEQLVNMFSSFGRIVEAKAIRDHVNALIKGYFL